MSWPPQRGRPGSVIYCVLEGEQGFSSREKAFHAHHLDGYDGDVDFHTVRRSLDLVADHGQLISDIQSQTSRDPALIVIDTLNRSLPGSESVDSDMAAYIKAADKVRTELNCAVMIVHHSGIERGRPRGHTSLTGAADAQLALSRDKSGTIRLKVEKMRNGPEEAVFHSRLEPVKIDEDGDSPTVDSCVVVTSDASTDLVGLSERQQKAFDAFREMIDAQGVPAPQGIELPEGRMVVEYNDWRNVLLQRGILNQEAANPREDFRRVKHRLKEREMIDEKDGYVWIVAS